MKERNGKNNVENVVECGKKCDGMESALIIDHRFAYMSIEYRKIIDAISTRKDGSVVVLSISDHLGWEDTNSHLEMLQEKLNDYIEFIEGGQIYEAYPNAKGKQLIIEIVSQYDYTLAGLQFIERARPIIQSIGAELAQRHLILPDDSLDCQ
jgi:hypothetical protein